MRSTFFNSTVNKSQDNAGPIFIITIGSLLNIDYQKSIIAFTELAQKQDKDLSLKKLPEILKLDERFKAGMVSVDIFRRSVGLLLNIDIEPDEFATAWNAMLGDVGLFHRKLYLLQALYNLQAISFTNPIYAKALNLESFYYYLSYRLKYNDYRLYEQFIEDCDFDKNQVVLLLPVRSLNGKELDNHLVTGVKEWAEKDEIKYQTFDPKNENIAKIIENWQKKSQSIIKTTLTI